MVFELSREDQDVIEIYQGRLESHTGKGEVQDALKSGTGVLQTERHSKQTKGTVLDQESRLVTTFLRDTHLPITPVYIQNGVHGGVAETADTVFHAGNGI